MAISKDHRTKLLKATVSKTALLPFSSPEVFNFDKVDANVSPMAHHKDQSKPLNRKARRKPHKL